jgi:hypothetical protein
MRKACTNLGAGNGADNSEGEIGQIWNAIQSASYQSGLDHRFILAIMMQESNGCVRVHTTQNPGDNPGLMQSHAGEHSCNRQGNIQTPCPDNQIFGMISDGVLGTSSGQGLAAIFQGQQQGVDEAASLYRTARIYNSGSIINEQQLEVGGPSTNCYASDVANRLRGWVYAQKTCTL